MKTSSFVLLALTLVSSFIDASEQKDNAENAGIKRKRVERRSNRLNTQEVEVAVRPIRNHVLLQPVAQVVATESTATANAITNAIADQVDSDSGSMKSGSDDEQSEKKQKAAEDNAVAGLMLLTRSDPSHVDIDDLIRSEQPRPSAATRTTRSNNGRRRTVTRRASVGSVPAGGLRTFTEGAFLKGTTKSFHPYFDERNMATAGNETLLKCFSFSHFFELAKYLVENGARLTDNESLPAAFAGALTGDENSEVSAAILMELLKYDALGTIQLFVKVAKEMDQETASTMDTFLISLLMDEETAFLFFPSTSVPEIIKLLLETEMFPESLKYICSHFEGAYDKDMIIEAAAKIINSKNAALLEIFLENEWIEIHERIVIEAFKAQLTVASHLFGRFEPQTILRLMQKFNYPLNYTHDDKVNPEGDILLAAAMGNDLYCFKRLLLAGASYRVKMAKNMTLETIVKNPSANRPGFYQAIQDFESGALQAEIAAEDAANAPLNTFNAAVATVTEVAEEAAIELVSDNEDN